MLCPYCEENEIASDDAMCEECYYAECYDSEESLTYEMLDE
jgi:hypothetical protein